MEDPDISAQQRARLFQRLLLNLNRQALRGGKILFTETAAAFKKKYSRQALFEHLYSYSSFELELPASMADIIQNGNAKLTIQNQKPTEQHVAASASIKDATKNKFYSIGDKELRLIAPLLPNESSWHKDVVTELLGNFAIVHSPASMRLSCFNEQEPKQELKTPRLQTSSLEGKQTSSSVFYQKVEGKQLFYSALNLISETLADPVEKDFNVINSDDNEEDSTSSDSPFDPQDPANLADVPMVLSPFELQQFEQQQLGQFVQKNIDRMSGATQISVNANVKISDSLADLLNRVENKTKNLKLKLAVKKATPLSENVQNNEETSVASTLKEPRGSFVQIIKEDMEVQHKAVPMFLTNIWPTDRDILIFRPNLPVSEAREIMWLGQSIDKEFERLYQYLTNAVQPEGGSPLVFQVLVELSPERKSWENLWHAFKLLVLNAKLKVPACYTDVMLKVLQQKLVQLGISQKCFMQLNECAWYVGHDPNQERIRRQNWLENPQYCLEFVVHMLSKNLTQRIIGVLSAYPLIK